MAKLLTDKQFNKAAAFFAFAALSFMKNFKNNARTMFWAGTRNNGNIYPTGSINYL